MFTRPIGKGDSRGFTRTPLLAYKHCLALPFVSGILYTSYHELRIAILQLCFCPKMASEAISEHVISINFLIIVHKLRTRFSALATPSKTSQESNLSSLPQCFILFAKAVFYLFIGIEADDRGSPVKPHNSL